MILKKACTITLVLSILSVTTVLAATNENENQIILDSQYQSEKSSELGLNLTQYTYGNAPEDIRKMHEENCISIGKTVNLDDVIYVPAINKSNEVMYSNSNSTYLNNAWALDNGNRIEFYLRGTWYTVYKSTYVGYNYITSGIPVYLLQHLLILKGYDVGIMDGVFGAKTHSALINYQSSRGLSVDAICGQNTWSSFWW